MAGVMTRPTAALLFAIALAAAACPKANDMEPHKDRNELRPEGDPNRAVQWELDAARRAGTVEAYDLFLARNPDHPLAEAARRERAALAARGGK